MNKLLIFRYIVVYSIIGGSSRFNETIFLFLATLLYK